MLPETSARRPGGLASLTPRLGVPARLRPAFYALIPIIMASWALGGLYLSLGPSVAASLFGLSSHVGTPPRPPDRESASSVVEAATIMPSTYSGVSAATHPGCPCSSTSRCTCR